MGLRKFTAGPSQFQNELPSNSIVTTMEKVEAQTRNYVG